MSIERIRQFFSHPFKSLDYRFTRLIEIIRECFYYYYYGKNIILMESHYPFDGNSGALYFYMQKQKKFRRYTYVWIIKGFKDGSFNNSRRVMVYSLENESKEKRWLINHARFSFFDDVPIQAKGKNAKTIYLRHGCPGIKRTNGLINTPSYVNFALCTSKNILLKESAHINFPSEKFFISGMPRNDVLFQPQIDIFKALNIRRFTKIILWLPTFRKVRNSDRCDSTKNFALGIPLIETNDELILIDEELNRMNTVLIIKTHPIQDLSIINLPIMNNIIFLSHQQLLDKHLNTYSLLSCADALVTDYSSVVFDYMLLDRPIAFTQDDINEYKLGVEDYFYQLTPGYRIRDLDGFVRFIQETNNNIDSYYDKRRAVSEYIHDNIAGDNCKRILKLFNV